VTFEFWNREWQIISGAPVLAIALVVIGAGLAWWLHRHIYRASMDVAKQWREIAEQKAAKLERQISELETLLSARREPSIASAVKELRHTTADLRTTLEISGGIGYVPF